MSASRSSQRRLTVAAAQYALDPVPDFEAWTARVSRWAEDGARTGAQLLVFPEYGAVELAATRGAAVTSNLAATIAAVADLQPAASAHWSALARRHGVHILAPSGPERRGDGFVNAARLHSPDGGMGVQEKLILTPFEHAWGMSAGTHQRVFETALGMIGVAICYDSEFPLLVRALAEAGADVVLIPSCTEHVSGFHRVRNAAMARALENQIATVMSPTVGHSTWSAAVDHNAGAAGLFVPPDVSMWMTGVIAEGALDAETWVSGEIDLDRLAELRRSGEMRNRSDWSLQRGATALGAHVEVIKL